MSQGRNDIPDSAGAHPLEPALPPASELRWRDLEQVAHQLADAAAGHTLALFRTQLDVDNKFEHGFDPVTFADRQAEQAIRQRLAELRPMDGMLGEEFGERSGSSGLTWIVDPIDGTRAYITGMPQWGILLGVHDGHRSRFGMVDQPYLRERYVGYQHNACLYLGGVLQHQLHVRPCASLESAMLMCTTPDMFSAEELPLFERVRRQTRLTRFGGDCYAYCMLASGFIDLVIESSLQIYDIQPLIPIIEAAGGQVTNWQGKPVTEGGAVIASGDPRCHAQALSILSEIHP